MEHYLKYQTADGTEVIISYSSEVWYALGRQDPGASESFQQILNKAIEEKVSQPK